MPRWIFQLIRLGQQLWIRIALFSAAAIVTAALAMWMGQWVPEGLSEKFGGDAVHLMLTTLSSSMLMIATFSLGTMVSAHTAATSNATPRAAPLMMQENLAQNALSVFVGAFVYSVIVLIAIEVGIYSAGGRTIVFFITLLALALVVITLVRWIDELGQFGQMNDTLDLIESRTEEALQSHVARTSREVSSFSELPDGEDIFADAVGYVQLVDLDAIHKVAHATGRRVYLLSQAGTMTHRGRALCRITAPDSNAKIEESTGTLAPVLRDAFVIGQRRTILQDPRFGMIMLAEVAARALSPGVNDPGTAIDVIVVATRVIDRWHQLVLHEKESRQQTRNNGDSTCLVFANPLGVDDLLASALVPIVQFGAGNPAIVTRLLKALGAIAGLHASYHAPTKSLADELYARAIRQAGEESDRRYISECFSEQFDGPLPQT